MTAAGLLVRTATVMLPAGPVRERYRRELLAELSTLAGRARPGFAIGALTSAMALRAAISAPGADLVFPTRKPLRCKLGMHRYRWECNPDGDSYLRCTRCGDDKGDSTDGVSMSGNISTASFGFG